VLWVSPQQLTRYAPEGSGTNELLARAAVPEAYGPLEALLAWPRLAPPPSTSTAGVRRRQRFLLAVQDLRRALKSRNPHLLRRWLQHRHGDETFTISGRGAVGHEPAAILVRLDAPGDTWRALVTSAEDASPPLEVEAGPEAEQRVREAVASRRGAVVLHGSAAVD